MSTDYGKPMKIHDRSVAHTSTCMFRAAIVHMIMQQVP